MTNKSKRISIIPIFIPHIGCPWRCIFCNQWRITGQHGLPKADDVKRMIRTYTSGKGEERYWEVAFYGGSFTAIPDTMQEELLKPASQALQAGIIDGIRCSTRPDCISSVVLERLQRYGLTTVELGVQSMDDAVLSLAKRGHTADDVKQSVQMLRALDFTVGLQLMPGLPGEDWNSLVRTTEAVCALKPALARIYPVVVIEDTELAERWRRGEYQALSIHEGVYRAAYMKQKFLEAGINVIRTGLQATENLDDPAQVLAGAYTPAMGEMVDTKRYQKQLFTVLDNVLAGEKDVPVQLFYNRRDTSRSRGIHNVNVKRAELRYGSQIQWYEDNSLPQHRICVLVRGRKYVLDMDKGRVI